MTTLFRRELGPPPLGERVQYQQKREPVAMESTFWGAETSQRPPTKDYECYRCGKKGHRKFQNKCRPEDVERFTEKKRREAGGTA